MKLSELLKESEVSTFDVDKFVEDCQYYFEAVKYDPTTLIYHGTDRLPSKQIRVLDFKEREKPQSMLLSVHNAFNNYFKTEFGWPFRNGLFTTGSLSMALDFGTPYVIFPIGKFEWLCNLSIQDLAYSYGVDEMNDGLDDGSFERYLKDRKSDWRNNTDLPKCIKSGKEIMIKCDKFYMINVDTFNKEIKNKL